MFEFFNYPNKLEFRLTIGPGEYDIKKTFYDAVKKLNIPRTKNSQLKPDKWSHIFCHDVLTASDYYEEDWDDTQNKIREFWQRFLKKEVIQINRAFAEIESAMKRMPCDNSTI